MARSSVTVTVVVLVAALANARPASTQPASTSSFPWKVGSGGAIARSGDTLFVEARAASSDRRDGAIGLAVVSAVDGMSDPMPAIDQAKVVIGDGRGGWFVGGRFTSVGGTQRRGVAHVLANGAVDSAFVADVSLAGGSADVNALTLQGPDLVIGGRFDAVNLVPRANIAIVDAVTGAPRSAAPAIAAGGVVYDLATTATRVYVVGQFAAAGGYPRRNIAAFDVATGALATGFVADTDPGSLVLSVSTAGGAVFVGGGFGKINGIDRRRLAKLDAATGEVNAIWNPGADDPVVDLTAAAGLVFVGGTFTEVGGQPRSHLAAIDPTSGAVSSWRADVNGSVLGIAVDGGVLYLAGYFTTVGGVSRLRAAAVTASAPAIVLPWNPSIGWGAYSVATSGTRIGIADRLLFGSNATTEQGLAAFNLRTGRRLAWGPSVNGSIRSMVTTGTRLVIGGNFTLVAGEVRPGLAAFDVSTLVLTPLSIVADGEITALTALGDVLYVSGLFFNVNDQPRLGLAAVDLRTGQLLPWSPVVLGRINAMTTYRDRIILGGDFLYLGDGSSLPRDRSRLGAVTAAGELTTLDGGFTGGDVAALAVVGDRLYVGGSFTQARGINQRYVAAFDLLANALLPWAPDPDGRVYDIDVHRGYAYLAGAFTSVAGLQRRAIARVTAASGAVTAWAPPLFNSRALAAFDDGVAVTGQMTNVGDDDVHFFPESGLAGQPGPPVRPAARVVGATLRLDWHAPVVGPRPTGYVLEAGSGPGLSNLGTIPLSSSSFAIGGVPPGAYYVRVRAVGPGGTSSASDEVTFAVGASTCTAAPTTPDPPSVVVTGNAVLLGWRPAGGSPPTAYRLDVGTSEGSRNLGSLPMGGAVSLSTSGVPAGAYFVRVVASNACGDSQPSADARIGVGGVAGPPGAPLEVTSAVAGSTVTFSWVSSTVGGPVSAHVLEAGTGPGLSNLAVVPLSSATTFVVAGIPPGTYYVRVRAAGGANLSLPSAEHLLVVS